MATFQEKTTRQRVVTNDPNHIEWFKQRARWELVDDTPAKPKEPMQEPTPAQEPTATDAQKPGDNATRDEWVAYALAHGKTEQELRRVRVSTIREWFN